MAISERTRRVLWGNSGGRCAKCRQPLIQPATEHDREALVGEECHVVSAAAGGPRHGPPPPGGYHALENLLLLCSVCHQVVDAQPASFPAADLRKLRGLHELWVAQRTGASDRHAFSWSLTPIPAQFKLSLITSGRQLVDLICDADNLETGNDEPRSNEDAELIAALFDRLGDVDVELGPGEPVRLAREFHRLLRADLAEAGIALYGAVADRRVVVHGAATPWRTSVVRARYAA